MPLYHEGTSLVQSRDRPKRGKMLTGMQKRDEQTRARLEQERSAGLQSVPEKHRAFHAFSLEITLDAASDASADQAAGPDWKPSLQHHLVFGGSAVRAGRPHHPRPDPANPAESGSQPSLSSREVEGIE